MSARATTTTTADDYNRPTIGAKITIVILLILMLIQTVLVWIRVDGDDNDDVATSWHLFFIPSYILFVLCIMIAVLNCVSLMNDNDSGADDDDD